MALRGYFYQRLPFRTSKLGDKYYLKFNGKAHYKVFDDAGIPLVKYHGKMIYFPVTIANYFLGKLDSGVFNELDSNNIYNYLEEFTDSNGLIRHNFDEINFGNRKVWYSHLAQSMFYSLLIRMELAGFQVSLKYLVLLQDSLFHRDIYRKGVFVEYPTVENQPQNGQMFAMFALLDMYHLKKIPEEVLEFHMHKSYDLALSLIHPLGWTYYSKFRLSSPFYHRLHLDMYRVLFEYDNRFKTLYYRGLLGFLFYPYFLTKKIIEKYGRV
jgi:hypothetical protein